MAWLWETYDEFNEYVAPVARNNTRIVRFALFDLWFQCEEKLIEAVSEIVAAETNLREKGYTDYSRSRMSDDELGNAPRLMETVISKDW